MNRITTMALAGLAAAALVSSCSSTTINQGGDTKCGDFTAAEEATQNEAVTKMLEDQKGTAPMGMEVTGTRLAVLAYCQTVGTPDATISQAPRA
ncbi:hypothetical protein [Micromonospora sp. WMMD736]|uniref:hypothetical protein n=1 Tax=Micromonospora sp. WMMD736 TaxID=3404112 RepID=UPI003B928E23